MACVHRNCQGPCGERHVTVWRLVTCRLSPPPGSPGPAVLLVSHAKLPADIYKQRLLHTCRAGPMDGPAGGCGSKGPGKGPTGVEAPGCQAPRALPRAPGQPIRTTLTPDAWCTIA